MESSKLSEARRNIDRIKSSLQVAQKDFERFYRDVDGHSRDLIRQYDEASRYLSDLESELKRIENK